MWCILVIKTNTPQAFWPRPFGQCAYGNDSPTNDAGAAGCLKSLKLWWLRVNLTLLYVRTDFWQYYTHSAAIDLLNLWSSFMQNRLCYKNVFFPHSLTHYCLSSLSRFGTFFAASLPFSFSPSLPTFIVRFWPSAEGVPPREKRISVDLNINGAPFNRATKNSNIIETTSAAQFSFPQSHSLGWVTRVDWRGSDPVGDSWITPV